MICKDMDWIGYEAKALDPEIIKKMNDHKAECKACQRHWLNQKKTTEILKAVWSEVESQCIESEKLIDWSSNFVDAEEKNRMALHLDICPDCAIRHQILTEFFQEFKDKEELPPKLAPLPKSLQSALQKKKKEDFTARLSKTLSALADNGTKGAKNIRDRAEKIVEKLTTGNWYKDARPAIPRDAAEVDEDESGNDDREK